MDHGLRHVATVLAAALCWSGCAGAPPQEVVPHPPQQPPQADKRLTFEDARAMFAARGVQPGQPLPPLSLVGLDGKPADLDALRCGRPWILVTCSLTCNVARRQQAQVDALRQRLGGRAAVVMVYTVDAHPSGDPCPYTGTEWVPADNERDGVLVPQPRTLAERLVLAQRYASGWARGATVLVDTMDDASWRALGQAPNLGLCVGRDGVVLARSGWFDAEAMASALDRPVR